MEPQQLPTETTHTNEQPTTSQPENPPEIQSTGHIADESIAQDNPAAHPAADIDAQEPVPSAEHDSDAVSPQEPAAEDQQQSEHLPEADSNGIGSPVPAAENEAQAAPVAQDDRADVGVQEPQSAQESAAQEQEAAHPAQDVTESNSAPAATLEEWWEQAGPELHDIATLGPDGTLSLKAVSGQPERALVKLTNSTAVPVANALREKFRELTARVAELEKEWEEAGDKTKLQGKVERLRHYLNAASALGDYAPLFQKTDGWDEVLRVHSVTDEAGVAALVEKAESLAGSEDWKETANTLKALTDQWRAMPQSRKFDALTKRFEAAKDTFFDRRRRHQEEVEQEMLRNLDLKLEMIEQAEKWAASDKWKDATDGMKALTDRWKDTGRVAPEKNNQLWNRFSAAKDVFFERKRKHFEVIDREQQANYALKEEIVKEAESLAESTDWQNTSNQYTQLLERWKKVGRVPVEKADALWNRMNRAKDTFFNNKRAHFDTLRVGQDDNLAQKMALIRRAEDLKNSSQWREVTEEMNELLAEWKNIGPVPREHNAAIWDRFIHARQHFFKRKDEERNRHFDRIENMSRQRASEAAAALQQFKAELQEEEEKLTDFRQALGNISPGPKATELRLHLERLIPQTEKNVAQLKREIAKAEAATQKNDRPKHAQAPKPQQHSLANRDNSRRGEEKSAEAVTAVQADASPAPPPDDAASGLASAPEEEALVQEQQPQQSEETTGQQPENPEPKSAQAPADDEAGA